MRYEAESVADYISLLPPERREPVTRLYQTVRDSLPTGYAEHIAYGMIGFAVPHSIYPAGYHASPQDPVPFIGIASQKHFIAFYHMGLYAMPELMAWFEAEYPKHARTRLDKGKSCIRFRQPDDIPYGLLAELCRKVSVDQYLDVYSVARRQGTGHPKANG